MRFARFAFWAVIALGLATLAVANRAPVSLRLLPDEVAAAVGLPAAAVSAPLFVVVLAGIVGGVLLGYVAEWLRERKFRSEARSGRREAERLSREIERMKAGRTEDEELLALLDEADGPAR